MRSYRGHAVLVRSDFPMNKQGALAAKQAGCFPDLRSDQFFMQEFMRLNYGDFKKGTKAFKAAYRAASARLQYLKRKKVVANSSYGVWSIINGEKFQAMLDKFYGV